MSLGEHMHILTHTHMHTPTHACIPVIEKHYIDCNLLMSGQAIIIVSPGAAVFDVRYLHAMMQSFI